MAEKKARQGGRFGSIGKFLSDVRFELGKVIWPKRDEVVASTLVVLIAVVFFAAFIGVIDLVFVSLIRLISA